MAARRIRRRRARNEGMGLFLVHESCRHVVDVVGRGTRDEDGLGLETIALYPFAEKRVCVCVSVSVWGEREEGKGEWKREVEG